MLSASMSVIFVNTAFFPIMDKRSSILSRFISSEGVNAS